MNDELYRAYCFLTVGYNRPRLTTSVVTGREEAARLLDALLVLPGVTGGGLEVKVAGIGWCLANECEETVTVRRRW